MAETWPFGYEARPAHPLLYAVAWQVPVARQPDEHAPRETGQVKVTGASPPPVTPTRSRDFRVSLWSASFLLRPLRIIILQS